MRKIIIKIAILLFLLVAIDRSFDFLFTKVFFEKTISGQAGGTLNYLIQNKSNVNFLILGTSRAIHQIDPAVVNASSSLGYNAGVDGLGKSVYNKLLLDIAGGKIHPEIIIFQIDVNDYFHQTKLTFDNQLRALYPFYNQSPELRDYLKDASFTEKLKLFFHMYRYNGKFYNILFNFAKRKEVGNNSGFIPLNGSIRDTQASEAYETKAKNLEIDTNGINAIKQIIEFCNVRKIKLYIVLPPSYNNVWYNREKLDIFKKNIQIPNLIDMSDISQFDNLKISENWKDVTHLNNIGAKKFSGYLRDSLIERNAFN